MSSIDLTRLVDLITAEVIANLHSQGAHTPVHCSCHGLLYECCPHQVQGVLDAGATRLGLHAAGGRPGDVAGLIDHTLLKPEASQSEIEALCREASEFKFATVCVNPTWVANLNSRASRQSASISASVASGFSSV